MCNAYCILFAALNIAKEEIRDKKVIEVGSLDVNGTVRPLLETYRPAQYLGIDVQKGRGVDVVCNAEDIMQIFQKETFDVLISTEMLEHVRDWKLVIGNLKKVVKRGGKLVITTRSLGYPYHGYPYDFWRYEVEDFKSIFSDCVFERLESDKEKGVFAKIVKPIDFVENDLTNYGLHSMIVNRRTKNLRKKELQDFLSRNERKRRLFIIRNRLRTVMHFLERRVLHTSVEN